MKPYIAKPKFISEPFEWIYISAGNVELQYAYKNMTKPVSRDVVSFFVSKYPITIEQYELYIDETGKQPWSDVWHQKDNYYPLHPMIDLFWHEAMSFVEWFSNKCDYKVQLPTQIQWQRAAQGDDSRIFPWGNDKDFSKCNVLQSRIKHTTPVTAYPRGASPFGVMDMMGNVFEWCIEDYYTGEIPWSFDPSPERTLNGGERAFKGCSYNNTLSPQGIKSLGAVIANFSPYMTGLRPVTRYTLE